VEGGAAPGGPNVVGVVEDGADVDGFVDDVSFGVVAPLARETVPTDSTTLSDTMLPTARATDVLFAVFLMAPSCQSYPNFLGQLPNPCERRIEIPPIAFLISEADRERCWLDQVRDPNEPASNGCVRGIGLRYGLMCISVG